MKFLFLTALLICPSFIVSAKAQSQIDIFLENISAGPEIALPGASTPAPVGMTIRVGIFTDLGMVDASSFNSLLDTFVAFETTEMGFAPPGGQAFPGVFSEFFEVFESDPNVQANTPGQLAVIIGDSDAAFGAFTSVDFSTPQFTTPPTPTNVVVLSPDNPNLEIIAGTLNPTGGFLIQNGTFELTAVPEPTSAMLLLVSGLSFTMLSRRRRSHNSSDC